MAAKIILENTLVLNLQMSWLEYLSVLLKKQINLLHGSHLAEHAVERWKSLGRRMIKHCTPGLGLYTVLHGWVQKAKGTHSEGHSTPVLLAEFLKSSAREFSYQRYAHLQPKRPTRTAAPLNSSSRPPSTPDPRMETSDITVL
jgi:hypothetical protein